MTRRSFQKIVAAGIAAVGAARAAAHLRIGVGCYTYRRLPIEDMIGQLKALRIDEIEMSRGEFMPFSKPPLERFQAFRRSIDEAGIRCVSWYAAAITEDADLDSVVRFAKVLGATHITGDATGEVLERLDQRFTADGLTFGIHNHFLKQKFAYESPEEILRALESLSDSMGCTLDIGHIVSSGYDTVDAVRKLGPRIQLVHLKDIQAVGADVNVPLGTGLAKIPQVMQELHKINFKGLVALEYEKEGSINDDVARQIAYARELA
jgi:sugar phosphate isomerase/epimerase